LGWVRAELAPYYSHTGCPSVDPELLIRMMVIGYCYSIRSDRRLCQAVALDLAYRWFCRLGLEDRVPDHSTFSINGHSRFRDSDILRKVFENGVFPLPFGSSRMAVFTASMASSPRLDQYRTSARNE
jgi:hypothetical protein